jgi:hypothetical protein
MSAKRIRDLSDEELLAPATISPARAKEAVARGIAVRCTRNQATHIVPVCGMRSDYFLYSEKYPPKPIDQQPTLMNSYANVPTHTYDLPAAGKMDIKFVACEMKIREVKDNLQIHYKYPLTVGWGDTKTDPYQAVIFRANRPLMRLVFNNVFTD